MRVNGYSDKDICYSMEVQESNLSLLMASKSLFPFSFL